MRNNTQIGAGDLPRFDQLIHNIAGHIHGDCKANALISAGAVCNDRGVDANQLTAVVYQRPSRIAWVDRGVGLDEILVLLDTEMGSSRSADDAHRDGLSHAEWITDGQSVVAHLNFGRVADRNAGKVGGVDLDNGDIGLRVGSDNLGFELTLVGEGDADARGTVDDVIVCDDKAV